MSFLLQRFVDTKLDFGTALHGGLIIGSEPLLERLVLSGMVQSLLNLSSFSCPIRFELILPSSFCRELQRCAPHSTSLRRSTADWSLPPKTLRERPASIPHGSRASWTCPGYQRQATPLERRQLSPRVGWTRGSRRAWPWIAGGSRSQR